MLNAFPAQHSRPSQPSQTLCVDSNKRASTAHTLAAQVNLGCTVQLNKYIVCQQGLMFKCTSSSLIYEMGYFNRVSLLTPHQILYIPDFSQAGMAKQFSQTCVWLTVVERRLYSAELRLLCACSKFSVDTMPHQSQTELCLLRPTSAPNIKIYSNIIDV